MSVDAKKLTPDPVGRRHGYRLEQGDDQTPYSDPSPITLEVWDDGYNAEWRSGIGLDDFIEIVDEIEGINGADAIAWFGSETVEPYHEESTYPAVTRLPEFPDHCGNLRLTGDSHEIYWQDTKGKATVEVTAPSDDFDVFEYLYGATVPAVERLDSTEVVNQIKSLLNE